MRLAVVVGARGGIGAALCEALRRDADYDEVIGLGRPEIDLADEESVARAAAAWPADAVRLIVNAAGFLHDETQGPEKSLRDLDAAKLRRVFEINALGPALLMKHALPRLPRRGRAVFACLSARVGSIGDNRLGGWYGYRASKAAMNQFVRTAAIELRRSRPEAICVALHPGTVATRLSAPFRREGLDVVSPDQAARNLLAVIAKLEPADSGLFFDSRGVPVPW